MYVFRVSRAGLPTWYFALVVVRRGHRFLLTQEKKYGESWSIPGGRVEAGESLVDAAVREVLEETGVPIRLDGILRIEHTPSSHTTDLASGVRMRVIFIGSPIDDTSPKATPDDESLRAAYLTLAEIQQLSLRGSELVALLESVSTGAAQIVPLALLGHELSV